jgi:hypothetical protein
MILPARQGMTYPRGHTVPVTRPRRALGDNGTNLPSPAIGDGVTRLGRRVSYSNLAASRRSSTTATPYNKNVITIVGIRFGTAAANK